MRVERTVSLMLTPLVLGAVACGSTAQAQAQAQVHATTLNELEQQLRTMQREMTAQRSFLDEQAKVIARQQDEIDRLRPRPLATDTAVAASRPSSSSPTSTPSAAPAAPSVSSPPTSAVAATDLPAHPIGDSTGIARVEQVDAVLEGMGVGVLTPAGHFVLEPSVQYTNSSNNRLVFRGVELVPGIQIGLIDATNADRDTLVTTGTVRYGLTRNLEFEVRVPFLFRSDLVETTQQQQTLNSQQARLSKNAIGDVELAVRYQLNHPTGQRPILIGGLRVKTDTGVSPFSIAYDSSGVAEGLATGSGFWAVQPSLNVLLPSDPVVLFAGLNYLYQIPKTINRTIGSVLVGRVDPGGAIGGNVGFGFALNPRFSFSLGYEHTYIFPTRSDIGGALNRSDRLQIGSFAMGMAYRVSDRQSLNFGLEVGATREAPDVSVTVRMPLTTN